MSSKDKKTGGGRPAIRTLADLNRQPSSGDGSDDSDTPQEYYTGGEKSGMLVQDPTKGNGPDIEGFFEQVRQMGARPVRYEQQNPSSSSSGSFTGTGRTLSGEAAPTVPAPTVSQPPQTSLHHIVFWNNGFTVDDGPLRMFDDPENASFLESIKRSECPRELEPADRRTVVNVNLFRRSEDYQAPVAPPKPFQGVGRTLGEGSSSDTPPVAEPKAASSSTNPSTVSGSLIGLSVDDSLPSTPIQLRLADGTRMVARFNTTHTVGHIRTFIEASRPGMATNYQLQTGFPPKVLSDTSLTIEQAGLSNSVVIQKM
ncbi:plant UBX domain-containing protein 3-like [Carex rostrata]